MDEFKGFFQSKTVWAGIVAIASGVAGHYHYHVTPDDQASLIQLLSSLASDLAGLGAIVGRVMATKKIGAA